VQGTAGYLDPLIVNGLQHSVLTDGYAMGITMLVALTGQTAVGLKARCRMLLRNPEQPAKWQPPGVPDAAAGEWPTDVATRLAAASAGLTEEYAEDRVRLAEVLQALEAIVGEVGSEAHGEEAGPAAEGAAEAAAEGAAGGVEKATGADHEDQRECMLCMSAPRQVRFLCGHSVCCLACLSDIRSTASKWAHVANDETQPAHEREAAHKKSVALCPACTQPIGAGVAETGEAVNAAPTFVMQTQPAVSTHSTAPTAHDVGRPPDRSGRGRFRGRGARGRGGTGRVYQGA